MDWQGYSAIFAGISVLIAILSGFGKYVQRLSIRVTNAENTAKSAEHLGVSIAANGIEIKRVESEFNEHRVAIAEKYVSKDALRETKLEILSAIRDLSDRFYDARPVREHS